MIRKKIITICASASFTREMLEIAGKLKKLGIKPKLPSTANKMKKIDNFDVDYWKTWLKNEKDYKIKTRLMRDHFKKIIKSDGILVLNFEKDGIAGYIGGNTLMEMTIAFHYKKPIFIYSPITEDSSLREEILGMEPVFINQDLLKIVKRL